jgi:drug/metabolite transporter (DMT)-like permease
VPALPALVLGGILLGISPILVRISEIGPVATAFWRLAAALVPLVVIARTLERDREMPLPRRWAEHLAAALPGVFLAGDLATWHISLYLTSVANSTLLVNTTPVFVTLGTWVFLRRAPRRSFVAALAVSAAGIVMLKGGPGSLGGGSLLGDGIALCAAAFYAGYLMLIAQARQRFSAMTVMLWSTAAAALCTLPLAVAFESAWVPATVTGWIVVIALGWVIHAGGQGLIAYAMAWLPATFSSLTLLFQPVVAAILAWVVIGERLSALQVAGGVVVLAGIALARRT